MQTLIIGVAIIIAIALFGLITALILFVKLSAERVDYENLQKEYKAYKDHNVSEREEIQKLKEIIKSLEQENSQRVEYTMALKRGIKVKERKIELLEAENDYLLEHGPNILKLPLKKELFDEVTNGNTNAIQIDYKESTKNRYFDSENQIKPFHAVEVFNGYTNRHQSVLFKISAIQRMQSEQNSLLLATGDRLN
jgi:hypothetical protein